MKCKWLVAMFVLVAAASAQAGVLFDFEELATVENVTSLSSTQSGLTLTVTRSGSLSFDLCDLGTPPPSWGDRHLDPFDYSDADDYFLLNFSQPVGGVSVELTDFGADSDSAVLMAYSGVNAGGSLLGTDTAPWGGSSSPNFVTVSVTAAGIRSALVRGGSGSYPNSMYVDNVDVDAEYVIPEPATLSLLGLGGLVLARRRRRR